MLLMMYLQDVHSASGVLYFTTFYLGKCGNFNMVEKATNKVGHLPVQWSLGERDAWFLTKINLRLLDPNSCFFAAMVYVV